jgi:hypothetical protein
MVGILVKGASAKYTACNVFAESRCYGAVGSGRLDLTRTDPEAVQTRDQTGDGRWVTNLSCLSYCFHADAQARRGLIVPPL